MAHYQITVIDKGMKPATVANIVKELQKKHLKATISSKHVTSP